MRKLSGAITAAALAVSLLGAPSASAAIEVGNDCEANGMIVGATIFPLANSASSSLPASVASAGVATKWIVRVHPSTDVHAERLKVFRPMSDPHRAEVIAESGLENVTGGRNSFDIRIPVGPGFRFGVSGRTGGGAIACMTAGPGDVEGIFFGDSPVGSTISFTEDETAQAAVSAVVEPDSDNDGYGDETQDRCPKSAAYQGECPVVTLTATGKARKRSILVRVTASSEASVLVFGQVGWGFHSKRKPKAGKSKPTRLIVGLSGGTKTVLPGETARFTIPLPKTVLRRLGRIAPQESLKAKIAARATDLAGRLTTRRLTVRLKGRERA